MAPIKSRIDFSLDTVGNVNNDGSDEYFDQVVAMSQGVINQSFAALLHDLPDAAQMYYDHDVMGQLSATMDAPKILINGSTSNSNEVFYQLPIKSGSANLRNGTIVDLAGWVFTIKTALNEVTLSVASGDSPQLIIDKEAHLKDLAKKYKGFVPGDYSVQRLFCAISSAPWSSPEEQLSLCIDPSDGKTKTLRAFKDAKEQNKNLIDDICLLLLLWAKEEAPKEVSTLGIKFSLDKVKGLLNSRPVTQSGRLLNVSLEIVNTKDPTFKPVHIFTQVYPYLTPEHPMGVIDAGKDGMKTDGDYNCLLYCEQVDCGAAGPNKPPVHPLPLNLKLPHSGNLASPASGDTPELQGTFAMDRRVFLEVFLLPKIQELCQATQMYVGTPKRAYVDGKQTVDPTYALGRKLEDTQGETTSASDPAFAFHKVDGASMYQWKQVRSSNSNRGNGYKYYQLNYGIGSYGDHETWADSSVSVSWTAGSRILTVTGRVEYWWHARFAPVRDIKPDTQDMSEARYKLTGTWSINIEIGDPKDSVMDLKVTGLKSGTFVPEKTAVVPSDEFAKGTQIVSQLPLTKALEESLSTGVAALVERITKRFETVGKFVFPGHGSLRFERPILSANGSILSNIEYDNLTNSDGSVTFPQPVKKEPPPPPSKRRPITSTYPSNSLKDEQTPKLRWLDEFQYDNAAKVGRLKLVALNETTSGILFSYVKAELKPATSEDHKLPNEGYCLFNGGSWERVEKSLLDRLADWLAELKATLGLSPDDAHKTPAGMNGAPKDPKDDPPALDKDGYFYQFTTDWESGDLDVPTHGMNNSKDEKSIEFTIKTKGGAAFEVPPSKRFTLLIQGPVESIGGYPIRLHESWGRRQGQPRKLGEPTYAVDYKIAEIREDGTCDIWDLSDALKDGKIVQQDATGAE